MNFVELLPVLIPATATAIGTTSGLVYNLVQRKKEKKAKKEAEARSFYLHNAQTLVLSAERLNITGKQKKDYVMTRLENECVRAGVKVDYVQMSMAVERAVLVMNDHRTLNKPVSELLAEVDARTQGDLLEKIEADMETTKSVMGSVEGFAGLSLEAAEKIYEQKVKKNESED